MIFRIIWKWKCRIRKRNGWLLTIKWIQLELQSCSKCIAQPGPGIPDLRIDQTGSTWPRRDPTWTAVVKSDLMRSKMTFQCLKMSEKTNDRGDTVKCKSPGANNSYFKSFLIKYIFKRIYCFFTVCSFRNKNIWRRHVRVQALPDCPDSGLSRLVRP